MSRKKTTSWHLFFQILDVVLSVVSGVVLIPLYLQFISTGTYGAWLATGNILVWVTAMDPGLTAVIEQRIASAYGEGDTRGVSNTIGAGTIFGIVISIGIFGFGVAISTAIVSLLNLDPSLDGELIREAFILAVVGSAILVFSYAFSGMARGLQGTFWAGVAGVSAKSVGILSRIVLLYGGFGLLAIPWGNICSALVSLLGYGGYLVHRVFEDEALKISFSWSKSRRLARLMGYNFLGKATNVISDNADSFIIARYVGAETVTVYRLTKKVPDLGNMFLNRVSVAFKPATSHLAGGSGTTRSRPVLIRLFQYLLWTTGLGLGGVLALNESFIDIWVGSDIYAGTIVNILICGLFVLRVLYDSMSNICYALGNIEENSIANAVQGGIYIGAIFIGAKGYGMVGVAVAAVLAHLAVSAWYYPYAFARLTEISKREVKSLLWEAGIATVLISILVPLFHFVVPEGWGEFFLAVGLFMFLYAGGLFAFSSAVRREAINFRNAAMSQLKNN